MNTTTPAPSSPCNPLNLCTKCGSSDTETRNAACWWVTDVLGFGEVSLAGRPVTGLGGFGLGAPTYDPMLLAAATDVLSLNDPCNLTQSGPTVATFQTAWNATSDGNMRSSTNASNKPNWPLTVDGKYGPNTAAAVQAALDQLSPTPCAAKDFTGSYTPGSGGGYGGYSAALVAAAQALDSYLAQNGCSSCITGGQPPYDQDALSPLVQTFKQLLLVNAGDTSSAAPTVTGTTINMSSVACQQSYGPGTVSDLQAVLGSGMFSNGTPCTNANCICLTAYMGPPGPNPGPPVQPPVLPPVQPPAQPPTQPPTQPPAGGSSAGPLIAGVLLVGGAAAAGLYAYKRRKRGGHHHPGLALR